MKRVLVLLVSLSGLLLYGGTATATAATHPATAATTDPAAASHGQNCVAQAEPAGSMETPTATCYTSFSAAISAATGGSVQLPAATRPASITPQMIDSWNADSASSFVLSIDYKDADFSGDSMTWTRPSNCGKFQVAGMPPGWNDALSSLITSTSCANTLYQDANFGGMTVSISKNTARSGLGSFNDLTTSQKWCTAKPC
jgi:hypothetical protein